MADPRPPRSQVQPPPVPPRRRHRPRLLPPNPRLRPIRYPPPGTRPANRAAKTEEFSMALMPSPVGASEISPRRKPWELESGHNQPRRGGRTPVSSAPAGASKLPAPSHGLRRGLPCDTPAGPVSLRALRSSPRKTGHRLLTRYPNATPSCLPSLTELAHSSVRSPRFPPRLCVSAVEGRPHPLCSVTGSSIRRPPAAQLISGVPTGLIWR
jgi:hypothetical protein